MKKLLSIITLLLLIGTELKAQKEVMFKMMVTPNRHYAMLMKMNMNMEMNVSGDTAMIKQMKSAGQTFPMIMTVETGTNADIKTSALNAANKIPFKMTMASMPAKTTVGGKETPIPMPATNETMFGTYTTDGKMSIDSVAGKKADDALKATMTKMMDAIQANVKFPEKPMKVGDSFTQDVPMDMPIAGMAAKLNSKTTYTLTSIENNKAYFDIKYVITMGMDGQTMAMNMNGGGDGKFVYDIPANYGVGMKSDMVVNYSMTLPQMQTMKMDGKMKMLMDVQTTISAN